MVLGLLVVVVVIADQATKWWAWRHSGTVTINSGGDELVGGLVGSWFRSSVGGAVLDVVDAAVLAGAVGWIGRRRRPTPVLISAALVVAGWSSNLSDRLGLHYWTAPGSVRGAVDFLRVGRGAVYNAADVVVVVATIGLGASLCWYRRDRSELRAGGNFRRNPPLNPVRATWPVLGVIAVAALAAYGVTHPGWMYTPARLWPTA